ncbi:FecCD family ABC transporter permease [Nocardioides sp. Kera G14]|uniref:FecCD family ABC transporter permease n=1 Tax=Nocardioides sp. Kera G14 TaxID=2884264 RepID=UPI001D125FEB|nr:iron chelate uptake ABC transporter family permease subunit [Nocardioides sp. Kera G14]UDY24275.1 iron chelate uptake ABC transporter family permease subunit [Nocardioides sp. Kera G14]
MTGHVILRAGSWSVRFRRRSALALAALVLAIAVAATIALMLGDYDLGPADVWRALIGGSDDPLATYFVQELRAPRIVAAVTVGAGLGVAGSLFQNITGNPLGSPDILGFTTGAATGALLQIIVLGGDSDAVAIGALAGGLGTALAVHLLTRQAGLTGQRLILVGLGVGALLAAVNALLVVRASLVAAQTAAQWLAGSLNAMLWPRALLTLVAVLVLGAAAVALARPLDQLALGDDVARSSGIPVTRVRTAAVVVGVALVSVATAATGPIAFVALAAPQLARRLTGSATPGLAGSAAVGALLVLISDVLAQRLFAPTELAVGVVTGALGGAYLIVLLILRRNR